MVPQYYASLSHARLDRTGSSPEGNTQGTDARHVEYSGHAMGGVFAVAHRANIFEGNRAEATMPLDQRGMSSMVAFVASVSREVARTVQVSGRGQF